MADAIDCFGPFSDELLLGGVFVYVCFLKGRLCLFGCVMRFAFLICLLFLGDLCCGFLKNEIKYFIWMC